MITKCVINRIWRSVFYLPSTAPELISTCFLSVGGQHWVVLQVAAVLPGLQTPAPQRPLVGPHTAHGPYACCQLFPEVWTHTARQALSKVGTLDIGIDRVSILLGKAPNRAATACKQNFIHFIEVDKL